MLICPTYPVAASFAEIGLLEFDYCLYAAVANLMRLPATHVPMRLNAKGLPIGFQVLVRWKSGSLNYPRSVSIYKF